jgi:hypothetical protein
MVVTIILSLHVVMNFFLTIVCHFAKKYSEKRIFRHKVPEKNHHKTLKNLKLCQESQLPAT